MKDQTLAQSYWAETFTQLRSMVQADPHADWSAQLSELCIFTIGLLEADDPDLYIQQRTTDALGRD